MPTYLNYAYLRGYNILHVIISTSFGDMQEEKENENTIQVWLEMLKGLFMFEEEEEEEKEKKKRKERSGGSTKMVQSFHYGCSLCSWIRGDPRWSC